MWSHACVRGREPVYAHAVGVSARPGACGVSRRVTHACGSEGCPRADRMKTALHFVAVRKWFRLAKLFTTWNKVLWVLFSLLLQSELQTGADGEQGLMTLVWTKEKYQQLF